MSKPHPSSRRLAAGPGWTVHDVLCTAGPGDRVFEEAHASVCVALVTAGSFQYRSSLGDAVLAPGALMLGQPRACFQCGHEHGIGDRCLAFHFSPARWEEIVAATPGSRRAEIGRASLPPLPELAPLLAEIEAACDDADDDAFEALAWRIGGAVATTLAETRRNAASPRPRDIKRVTTALRRIEEAAHETIPLETLARESAMSPFHFLRTFRQVVGLSPHQYVLRTRLHRAAVRLRRSDTPISAIAYDAGFNDLSTFNRRFKKVMGVNPGSYRVARR
ncbi:MAG TPA: AraC family transcriptional regulator [Dongiaceae bacterium]|jgi:AraC-like DNA-binding protein